MQIWGVVVTNIISNLVLNKLAMFKGINRYWRKIIRGFEECKHFYLFSTGFLMGQDGPKQDETLIDSEILGMYKHL